MAKSPPSFDFYPTNWIEGTDLLSDFAYRVYMRLLCYQWSAGYLPPTPQMMNLSRVRTIEEWNSVWSEISCKFILVESANVCDYADVDEARVLVNERLHNQRNEQLPKYQKAVRQARINGKKGGRPRNKTQIETKLGFVENPVPEEGSGKREVGSKNLEKRKQESRPTVEEVEAYCQSRGNSVDSAQFVAWYDSNGWVVGKARTPMKDWKAAVRTWEGREAAKTGPVTFQQQKTKNTAEALNRFMAADNE